MRPLDPGILVSLLLLSCTGGVGINCDRDGCDALSGRANDTGRSAAAGVVAYESDVTSNECTECAFSSTKIDFWNTAGTVSSAVDANAVVQASPAMASIGANRSFSQPLEAGTYLACVRSDCVNVTVHPNQVATLNVLMVFGPTQFFVDITGSAKPSKVAGFEVSRQ